MTFLKLTAAASGKPVRINFSNVASYSDNSDSEGTRIFLNWGNATMGENRQTIQFVKETPEMIDQMLGLPGRRTKN